MKICAVCIQQLPKEKFSKKQWQAKQHRRCKECIAVNREVVPVGEAPNNAPLPLPFEGASDEDLFKETPPREDECPICMIPQSVDDGATAYYSCCGKMICNGCVYAAKTADVRGLCPFCRAPAYSSNGEGLERINKRADGGDARAIYNLGCNYRDGLMGLRQNQGKANKLFLRAGELGCATAYNNIGYSYYNGDGVARDENKANYYYELAAMGGDIISRHNLGYLEKRAGNMDRAMKHWMISAAAGHDKSLTKIRECFVNGSATKVDFEKALRAHKESKDEMRSEQREAAAAAALSRS